MNAQRAPIGKVERHDRPGPARLHGRQPFLARGAWLALIALTLAIFVVSLPAYVAQLQSPCAGTLCQYQQLTPGQAEILKQIGLSLQGYTVVTVALLFLAVAVCWGVSALIVWRRPEERMALLVAYLLVALGPLGVVMTLPQGASPWQATHNYLILLMMELLLVVFFLFPSGRFAPHWMRWVLAVLLVVQVPGVFLPAWNPQLQPETPSTQVSWFVTVMTMAILAGVQLYRYRRVSGPVERQQTKWVVFGLALPCMVYLGLTVLTPVFPTLTESSAAYVLAYNESGFFLSLSLPLAFGFAMLRYQLWDIDVLINRTLVYGSLTVILALVYGGGVIGIQTVVGRLTHGSGEEHSPLIDIGVALIIVALFQPLHRRLQALIDRRFFRRRYDTARTLARFGDTLRAQADLEALTDDLMDVVGETMQPEHISLWLRPPYQQPGPVRDVSPSTSSIS